MKRVAVFAKPPVVGRVKTRLSPALPPAMACDLYRAMLADALAAAAQSGADESYVYWAPDGADAADSAAVPSAGAALARAQHGADLGARLAHAFGELLLAPDDRAVIIGADCPALGAEAIRRAFHELERHDLVLAPTRDGGYSLIGLSRACAPLFEGVAWSTERVLSETIERAERASLAMVLLEKFDDVDTPEDLTRTLAAAASGTTIGAATAGTLRAMGLLPGAARAA